MITTGTAFTCGGGRTVFCSEANWSLMMRHCRCLLLWDLDTAVEMRTTRCYKFIHVSVITMLQGDIGREDVGMLTQHRPHSAMCQSDFRSAWMGSTQTFIPWIAYWIPLCALCKLHRLNDRFREYRQGGYRGKTSAANLMP